MLVDREDALRTIPIPDEGFRSPWVSPDSDIQLFSLKYPVGISNDLMEDREQNPLGQGAGITMQTDTALSSGWNGGFLGLVFGIDPDTSVTYVSRSMEAVLGRPSSDILGSSFLSLVAEEDVKQVESALASCLSGSSDYRSVALKFVDSQGEARQFEVILVAIRAQDPVAGICVFSAEAAPTPPEVVRVLSPSSIADEAADMLPAFVTAVDAKGRIVLFNRTAETVTGYSRKEVVGRNISALVDAEILGFNDLEGALDHAAERRITTLALPVRTKDGELIVLPFRMRFLYDGSGKVTAIVGLAQDPRSCTVMEEESIRIDSRLDMLAETSADIVATRDPVETIETELRRLIHALSLSFGVIRLKGPENRPYMFCAGLDFKSGRELLECEHREGVPLHRSAEEFGPFAFENLDTLRRSVPEVGDANTVTCFPIRSGQDVLGCAVFGSSHRQGGMSPLIPILQVFCNQIAIAFGNARLSIELLKKNKMLQSLYETSQAVSETLDLMDVLHLILEKAKGLVNAESCFLFELDKAAGKLRCIADISNCSGAVVGYELAVGTGITGIVAEKGEGLLVEHAETDDRSVLVEGTPDEPSSLISVPLKIGEEMVGVMTLEKTSGVPFTKAEYQIIEMLSTQAAMAVRNACIFREEREHASTLQMYNVLLTHDVANFNVPIHGFLEMLMTDPKLDDKARRYVRNALTQSENISSLISDVRNLSRLKLRGSEKSLAPIDIVPLVNDIVAVMRGSHIYSDVELEVECQESSAFVLADPFVKDVFHNLLSNACKYGGGQVQIRISPHSECEREYWRIDVKDWGKGIPADRKGCLFKRFDQLDSRTGLEGHGLGLSVVGALCDRYSGRVWVEDRVPGDCSKGAVFSVILPKANKVKYGRCA